MTKFHKWGFDFNTSDVNEDFISANLEQEGNDEYQENIDMIPFRSIEEDNTKECTLW